MKDLKLPEELRGYLRKPLGRLVEGEDAASRLVAEIPGERLIVVGDVSYRAALEAGVKPKLAVVDFRVKRQEIEEYELQGRVLRVTNPPGWVTAELWDAVHEALGSEGEHVVVVDGEDDLAVLPCVIEADWGYSVVYGQPDQGAVLVEVDDEAKMRVGSVLKLMLTQDEWRRR